MSFYVSDIMSFSCICLGYSISQSSLKLLGRNMIENHPNRDFLSQFYPKAEELTLEN